ncbi:MAG: hypothetical protein NTW21_16270 [Verrucomicrobia bacterium]|nr:hypothetical protein [Verrucomicrobiota bacterium]
MSASPNATSSHRQFLLKGGALTGGAIALPNFLPAVALAADGGKPATLAQEQALFIGKNLSGWEGAPGWWTVEDGVLTSPTTMPAPPARAESSRSRCTPAPR